MPEQYLARTDTSNVANISWKEYFGDTTLVNLIEEALNNSQDALIALQRIEQAHAQVVYRKGLMLPTVSGGGVAAVRRFGLYTMDGAGNSTTEILPGKIVPTNLPDYLIGLQSTWEADITGKLRNKKKAAAARYLASVEGKNWLYTNLIAEVAASYYTLLSLDHELDIILSTISIQQNALDVVTIQKQHGAATELAINQFQSQLLGTQSLEFEIRQFITETESLLNSLLGRFPQPVSRNKDTFNRQVMNRLQIGVPSDLLRNRPDIKQAELELMASKADLRAARAAFYPSLNITGSVGFQAFQTNLLFTNPESFVFTLVGGLWAPVLNRSAIKAEFKAANAYQLESLYNYHKTILYGFTEVYKEVNNLNNLDKIYNQRVQQVDVLNRSVETSTELYKTGRANYLEVLLTQQNTLSAKLELVNVKRRQFVSTISLYKALGGGWK